MTQAAKDFLASITGSLGARQIVAWGASIVIGIFTLGTLVGAWNNREGFKLAGEERKELGEAIQVERRANARQDTAIRELRQRQDSNIERLEEIRLNTCLTLMEVRGDPNTDRCRRPEG